MALRQEKKSPHLDWSKVVTVLRTILVVASLGTALILSITFYHTYSFNKRRETVESNPGQIRARITGISSRRLYKTGLYEFYLGNRLFTGRTDSKYIGNVGDRVCVRYYLDNPSINFHCPEWERKDWVADHLSVSLQIWGIIVFLSIGAIGFKWLMGDKRLRAELSSKGK